MAQDVKLDRLRQVPLFSGLDRKHIELLGQIADEVDVPDGRALTRQGHSGSEFFVVEDGHVTIDRDGKRLATLGPGDFLGEIALIDGQPRTATATAQGATRLIVIGRRGFHTLMDQYPTVRDAVMEALCRRVRDNEPSALS